MCTVSVNVSFSWAYETGLALDTHMADELPYNQYYEYYGPDFNLHIQPSNMENLNTPNYLQKQETFLLQALKELPHAPSVQYSYQPPRDTRFQYEEEQAARKKEHESQRDHRPEETGPADKREFYAGDKDQDGTTMPHGPHVPQLIGAAHGPGVLVAAPSAPSASASAAGASSSVTGSAAHAAPSFHPNPALTHAGAPSISAPLAGATTAMDTA
jgi:hypothetical protein